MKRVTTLFAIAIAFAATSAHATVIAVLDSAPATEGVLSGGTLYDRSTAGDSIAGIGGSFVATELVFSDTTSFGDYWNAAGDPSVSAGFLQNGGQSASWTFSNLPTSTDIEVFVNWREIGQANNASNAPYTVNGSGAIPRDQTGAVPADLVLNDPTGDATNFSLLGTFNSGVLGQIVVGVSTGNNFTALDAAAIRYEATSTGIPTPAALPAGLAMLGLIASRRKA